MGQNSAIQWTGGTWTPIRARVKKDAAAIAEQKGYTSLIQIATKMAGHVGPHCEHCSSGCDLCYSEVGNARCLPFNGTGLPFDRRARDLVDIIVDEKILVQPLRWRNGWKIFVCSQTDLFGEWVSDEMIDRVFAVMALCPQHTFQVLTKRADRMREYLTEGGELALCRVRVLMDQPRSIELPTGRSFVRWPQSWPMKNVWLGVSVENQETADARIPLLLQTPAAIRFVSYEPALGPVDFNTIRIQLCGDSFMTLSALQATDALNKGTARPRLDWIIVGGESGPGARPFNIQWARNTIAQCKAAGVPCFVKQLGAKPTLDSWAAEEWAWPSHVLDASGVDEDNTYNELIGGEIVLRDKKGGDWEEWPDDLCVREFPEAIHA